MYKRDIENRIKKISETFRVLAVTGPRQVGKSTLLDFLMPKNMTKVSLDDETLKTMAKEDPRQFIEMFKKPLFIDEVQYAPELFPYIKMEVDKNSSRGQYWLSGSQAFDLMKGVTETLAGRVGIAKMNSFSYSEIARNKNIELFDLDNLKQKKYIDINKAFELIFNGGMPELYDIKDMDRNEFYNSYISTYIERDVRKIKDIGNVETFKKFMRVLAVRTGATINYSNIADEIGITDKTVKAWISVLVNTGIIYLLEPYSSSEIKRLTKMSKIIFMDMGLACSLANYESARALQLSREAGRFFESYIISEIIKGYENKGKKLDITHLRNKETEEIDLIIRKNNTIYPIEIKMTSTPKKEMIKNFQFLKKTNVKIGTGGLICAYDKLMKIDESNYIIPISSVIDL